MPMLDWKPIPGYEDLYEAHPLGKVRSVSRRVRTSFDRFRLLRGKEIKGFKDPKGGYFYVSLTRNKKETTYLLHQIILLTFVGPCPAGQECCHNDGEQENCSLENLRYDTHLNNMADRRLHAKPWTTDYKGERHHRWKLSDTDISNIKRKHFSGKYTQTKLGALYGVAQGTISSIVNNKYPRAP